MKQNQFEQQRHQDWHKLNQLLQKGKGKKDIRTFLPLYRAVAHDLAISQTRGYSLQLINKLNQLVIAGHNQLYRSQTHYLYHCKKLIVQDFPQALRQNGRLFLLASILFYLPSLVIGWLIQSQPDLIFSIMPPEHVASFEEMYNPNSERMRSTRHVGTDVQMFGFYILNNIGIAFKTFAYGLLAGVGSFFILIFNGLSLGAVSGYLIHINHQQPLFTFIIAHGAFELTAIVISGVAGMKLGFALLAPGRMTRVSAVQNAAKQSLPLIYGVFIMLIIAAVLEAFWSSKTTLAPSVKYGVGGVMWLLVALYFAKVGKPR